jgi:hypothetical protein
MSHPRRQHAARNPNLIQEIKCKIILIWVVVVHEMEIPTRKLQAAYIKLRQSTSLSDIIRD